MPNYQSHLAGGSIAFSAALLIIVPYYHPSTLTAAEWFLCALAGSLFPDIDIKSKGQKYFYWLLLLLFLLLFFTKKFIPLAIISILATIPLISKHRGLFHRAWFIIAGPLIAWQVASLYYPTIKQCLLFDMLFFMVGALSHLWLDMGLKKMLKV